MADMIDAKEAKQILGCDDDALNSHINGGAVRAQRIGGKLMVNKEDVQKLASEQDDGTIVLTGDSDNLQIDLGKVVDDTSETLIQTRGSSSATDSITFGDELEVINFEENKGTRELNFDDSKKTMDLNFTDQNTAVMTAVDETQIGGATAQLDTSNDAAPLSAPSSADSRRSVRSNRIRVEVAPVHPMWVAFMAVTTLLLTFMVIPYLVMSSWPRGDDRDAAKNQARGVDDNFWTGIASGVAGFSVEPSQRRFTEHNAGKEFTANADAPGGFRSDKYRGALKGPNEKVESFIIEKISDDGKQAIALGEKAKYPIVEVKTNQAGVETSEMVVDIGLTADK